MGVGGGSGDGECASGCVGAGTTNAGLGGWVLVVE